MEIAFNAERGIQDAIQELSESESTTVIISYSVMFIYVAIALGSFRGFYSFFVCIHWDFGWTRRKNPLNWSIKSP